MHTLQSNNTIRDPQTVDEENNCFFYRKVTYSFQYDGEYTQIDHLQSFPRLSDIAQHMDKDALDPYFGWIYFVIQSTSRFDDDKNLLMQQGINAR